MKNIEYQERGLKCDNVECDFRDETIKSIDYENWVNKPCPKCSDNLLTLQDFYNVILLESIIREVNEIPKEKTKKKERVTVEVDLHKTIKFNIKDGKRK